MRFTYAVAKSSRSECLPELYVRVIEPGYLGRNVMAVAALTKRRRNKNLRTKAGVDRWTRDVV